jgi:hypothetical protein
VIFCGAKEGKNGRHLSWRRELLEKCLRREDVDRVGADASIEIGLTHSLR